MNDLTGERIGFVVTGSFCTFSAAFAQAKLLREAGAELTPIFSEHAAAIDTRFGTAADRAEISDKLSANRDRNNSCGQSGSRALSRSPPQAPRERIIRRPFC